MCCHLVGSTSESRARMRKIKVWRKDLKRIFIFQLLYVSIRFVGFQYMASIINLG
jgi:hypothetical protein